MTSINSDIESFRSNKVVLSYCGKSPRSKLELDERLDKIGGWVADQEKTADKAAAKERIENVGKVLKTTINAIEKLQTGDAFDIASGTLEMISCVAVLAGGPYGTVVAVVCSIIGEIVSANKPSKPSLVEQIAEVVHNELLSFNNKLQHQALSGLKRRVSEQIIQLQRISREDKLNDRQLWIDYIQFLGELSGRLDSRLEFNCAKDADVSDFVTALQMYCHAHTCYMALLTIARGRFEDVGCRHEEIETIDEKMRNQTRDATLKLEYLSDVKYLAFIGRLPSANDKLMKILSLNRNVKAREFVASFRRSLKLPEMPDPSTVDSAATTVARQSVRLKLPENLAISTSNPLAWSKVVFVNETKFPMKIVSGKAGDLHGNLQFVQDVKPHSHYERRAFEWWQLPLSPLITNLSTGGYLIIYNNGNLTADEIPHGNVQVIEFALSSFPFVFPKVNIQDKTAGLYSKGEDTHATMTSKEKKVVYWVEDEVNYMAVGEIRIIAANPHTVSVSKCWLFVVQDFDPSVDVVEEQPSLFQL